jgi:hypothetical protein
MWSYDNIAKKLLTHCGSAEAVSFKAKQLNWLPLDGE